MKMAYADRWQPEIAALKAILAASGLVEENKWGKPCYTFEGANVVIIEGFKDTCGLGFFQGALLKDPRKRLVQLGQTQAARMMMFGSAAQIEKERATIKAYVREAAALAKAGRKVQIEAREPAMPYELDARLRADPAFRQAFEALTPGRRRSWLFHIADAKQAGTRLARIDKSMPLIRAGRGHLERP